MIESSKSLNPIDYTEKAQRARCISGFTDLHGFEFVAKIDVELDKQTGLPKNIIRTAITPEHASYNSVMSHTDAAHLADVSSFEEK